MSSWGPGRQCWYVEFLDKRNIVIDKYTRLAKAGPGEVVLAWLKGPGSLFSGHPRESGVLAKLRGNWVHDFLGS